ncbi:MAG: EAL domain-containing protein [Cellvibrionaceae bacterium]|nr:EAL domain-containing protein [Cellvibrionaceae bacterium]
MSLQRRLMLITSVLLLCLLAANLVVIVYNARLNFSEQLQVHAQDTATALGFSLSQAAAAEDSVQVASMVDVIFDRGYYRRIIYRDLHGRDVVRRELPVSTDIAPQWFVAWLRLPEAGGSAGVAAGWQQLGEVEVVSHPGFAYQDLWRVFCDQLWLFSMTLLLCYALLGLALRYVLRPMRQMQQQAEAICQREFVIHKSLSRIPEFRQLAKAMNKMVLKVQQMFAQQVSLNDRLHHQIRTDEVTELSNRRDFDERLLAYLRADRVAASGLLMLLHAGDLAQINRHQGREQGDIYLRAIADVFTQHLRTYPDALCSRHRGADFAVFVPALAHTEGQALVAAVYAELSLLGAGEALPDIYLSAIFVPALKVYADGSGTEILAAADAQLSRLQSEQRSGSACTLMPGETDDRPAVTHEQWLSWFNEALVKGALNFHYQPVWQQCHGEQQLLFNELLTQLTVNGQDYPARFFMPMATRLQKTVAFDHLVVEKVFAQPLQLPEQLCLNLSIAAVQDVDFCRQLELYLNCAPALAQRITFELPASGLTVAEQAVREFAAMIKHWGARFSLHHFGRDTAKFAYLQTLGVDYLKIDRCFIQHITRDQDARFFVQSLTTIAKTCDVMVLAEGIETADQWQQLLNLGVQGGQGYWLGRPQPQPVVG